MYKYIYTSKNEPIKVDECLFEFLNQYKWSISNSGYAFRMLHLGMVNGKQKQKCLSMHRFIWEYIQGSIPVGFQIDHRDGNKCNNTLGNLQLLTPRDNTVKHHKGSSSTGFSWVRYEPTYKKNGKVYTHKKPYKAAMHIDGKQKTLGYFYTAEEAYAVAKAVYDSLPKPELE